MHSKVIKKGKIWLYNKIVIVMIIVFLQLVLSISTSLSKPNIAMFGSI